MSTREVILDGGSPWGFRMHGGADVQQPLRISRVNPGSKAAQRGIREGDFISSINGQTTRGVSNTEAHALLRNAGNTLTLGLNQETTGSPKRRAQKLSQEAQDDILKRSSITSTSSSIVSNFSTTNIISNTTASNESFYSNGVSNHKRTPDETLSHAASNYSPYIKNGAPSATSRGASDEEDDPNDVHSRDANLTDCNRITYTARTLIATIHPVDSNSNESAAVTGTNTATDAVGVAVIGSEARSDKQALILNAVIMADNVHASSRSRKQRRSRANRKKSKKCTAVTQHDPTEAVGETDNVTVRELSDCDTVETKVKETYRVESPITVPIEKKTNPMVKSRSLDDEDQVKIMEITDETQIKSASESIAIVSEAESDVEWETVSDIQDENSLQQIGKLSIISLPLEEQRSFESSHISPEDERSLRDFLKGLDLVNSPEESVKRIEKPSTSDSAKARKAKKRAALVQHFLPYYQNPRYLDVISEEGSDVSDKDTRKNPFARPLYAEDDYDEEDDVFVDVQKEMRKKFQSVYVDSQEGAILVDTKLVEHDHHLVKEATWSTAQAETKSGAEVVYLEDSSSSMTPSDLLDQEETVDADDEDDVSIDLDKSFSENFDLNSTDSASLVNTDMSITLSKDCEVVNSELTPPSPPVNISANGVEQPLEIDQPSNKTTIDFLQRLSLTYCAAGDNNVLANDEICSDSPDPLKIDIEVSPNLSNTNEIDEKIKYLQELINNVNSDKTENNGVGENNLEILNLPDIDVEMLLDNDECKQELNVSTEHILKVDTLDRISDENENKILFATINGKTDDIQLENSMDENMQKSNEHDITVKLQTEGSNAFKESNLNDVKQEECTQESKTTKEKIIKVENEVSNTIKESSAIHHSKIIKENTKEETRESTENVVKVDISNKLFKESNIKEEKIIEDHKYMQETNKKEHIIKIELVNEVNKSKELNVTDKNKRTLDSNKKEHIIKVELLDDVKSKSTKSNINQEKITNESKCMKETYKKEHIIKVELLDHNNKIKESNIRDTAKGKKNIQDINATKEHIIKVELQDELSNNIKESNIKETTAQNKIVEESSKMKEHIIKVELLDEVSNEIKQFNLKSPTMKETSTEVKFSNVPTENDNELNKELKQLCESLLKTRSDEYSNTTETSRPDSVDSACSSSRSTSQCTTIYNPMHSSLTNIAAMLREGSFDDRASPGLATLRELCVKTLLSMPFGKDIIEELATVSLSLEEMARQNPSLQSPTKPSTKSPSPLMPVHNKTDDDDSLLVSTIPPVAPSRMDVEKWIGMPTEIDPNVLLCLSPSQRDFIETTKTVPKEADNLLDLHRKYIERRGYHEAYEMFKATPQKEVRTVHIKIEPRSENNLLKIIQNDNSAQNTINYNNYLKTFTREIPRQVTKSPDSEMRNESNITNGNIHYDTYIKQLTREVPIQVERQIHKPVNNKIYEGAYESDETKNDRLNARRLNEWLNLARTSDCADKINNLKEDSNRTGLLQSTINKVVSQQSCDEHQSHSTASTFKRGASPRRYSLPFNLYEQQMQYILEKEREIEREIEKLREEKAKLEKYEDETITGDDSINNIIPTNKMFDAGKYQISRKGDIAILQDSPTEIFREKMYNEYMCKVAERQERKQNKVIKIKITTKPSELCTSELSPLCDVKHASGIEDEFIKKVKERMDKLGLNEESDEDKKNGDISDDSAPVLVMDGGSVAEAKKLPKHLQEFVDFTRTTASSDDGVWTPGKGGESPPPAPTPRPIKIEFKPPKERSPPKELQKSDEPAPVVWTPRSAGSSPTAERKEFRPVSFESPVLSRKNKSKETTPVATPEAGVTLQQPPWEVSRATTATESSHTVQESTVTSSLERRLTTSHSAPAAGLNNLSKLPRAQNPTITLLQKAREGQLPRGASYIEQQQTQQQSIPKHRSKDDRPPLIGPNEILYTVKNEYMSESDSEKPKKMANLGPRKFEGIGPTTKDGMPIVLRSEVKDGNQAKWYKQMYDTLHRAKNDDEYVTVRYKTRRGRYPYTSAGGYLSEPEPNAYDSDAAISASKYATLDRRRLQPNRDKENEYITYTVPRNKYMSASVKHSTDVYKNQPGRIENYVTGHSSISEKEAKEWWDEVMEIFDGHLEQQKHVPPQTKSYMSHALKESGYESDSTLVFRRREDAALQLSPHEQKEVYKNIQKGGDVPLHGLRKLAPERPKDDTELEYFPISPTLTRIRIHKNIKPVNEILCYPVTVHHNKPSQVFSTYKRSAPSSSSTVPPPPKLPTRPPSPPKRRSSRNSHTLRLISTMTIHTHSPKSTRRHDTCFKSTADKSNVKYLRDRISCKLRSPTSARKGVKVTKTMSTYPSTSKESITTSLSKDAKTNKIKNRTDVCCKNDHHYSRSTASSTARRCCRLCSFSVPPKVSEIKSTDRAKPRGVSLERTFGSEKRKVDLTLSKLSTDSRYKLIKSPDLVSPTEVRKGVQKQKDIMNFNEKYPPGTTVKKSTSMFASAKNGLKSQVNPNAKSLNVTVAISARGKELLNPSLTSKGTLKSTKSTLPSSYMTRLRTSANSPAPSNVSDKSKLSQKSRTVSVDSLHSPVLRRKTQSTRPTSISRMKTSSTSSREELRTTERDKKKTKKTKKDQSNEELKKDKKKVKEIKIKDTTKNKKCHGRAAGTEVVKKLNKMEIIEPISPVVHSKTIEEQHKNIFQSDSFFQHLFLRDILTSPTPSVSSKSSYIIERTKMLQNTFSNTTNTDPTVKALKVYLNNRRPVSESKFKTLDREIMRSRSASPSTLTRSLSEHRHRFDSISEVSNEDSYHDRRTASPDSIRSRRSSSLPATKILFTEASRPVSPCYDQTMVRYRTTSPSPSPLRSPSRRKIHNIKPPASITVEGVSGLTKKTVRARSAGEAEVIKRDMYYSEKSLTPSVSSVSLSQIADPHEYKTYVTELRHSTRKCDRFKELNSFYSSLERLSQLEVTTSSLDLRPRRKHEDEIIDYDRWRQVRTRERAEEEFSTLYKKLKQDQRDKDLFFHPKDVEAYRWKFDRGLKIKEQSVDNIKEQFEKLKENESPLEMSKRRILEYQKDVYKPLWRGNSVLNLVSKISEKRSQSETRAINPQRRISYTDNMLSREFGSKLWSSLSVEQVNALKNQLSEIYSHAPPKREIDYSINVEPQTKITRPNSLVIRRNSVNEQACATKKPTSYVKSSSIGAISNQSLSENDKKRLSLSLSQEVRDKVLQKQKYITSLSIVLGKETRGAIAAADANVRPSPECTSPRTCYSLEPAEDYSVNKQKHDKDFLLVLTKDESEEEKQNVRQTLDEWSQPKQPKQKSTEITKRISSTSETESASSDTSTKTAIFMGKKENLNKKIEYFERSADVVTYVPTIHKPADDVAEEITDIVPLEQSLPTERRKEASNLVTSQSYADLKELFGERELMKFATIPLSATRKQAYTRKPLLRATNISPIRTMSEASSNESLFRSRSLSPESEKFWNAYLALINGADVRKLTEKFESLKDFYSNRTSSHRRYKSDSELDGDQKVINMFSDREFGDVYWLRKRYENISRGRSRTRREGKTSPIPKTPLKLEDRLMPHINIISKLASLYPKKSLTAAQKQESTEELAKALGCPVGEVEKLREKFDSPERNVSLLGHMFTSSPNVHELRDIAPYLAGPWIAHQYPRYQDNTRSLSAPEEVREEMREKKVVKKDRLRPKSASPPRSNKRPSSILKSHHHHHARKDIFANQQYDPNIHRPAYRYQPISPKLDRGRTRSWSPVAKHTVTFKEPELGPTPPPKGRIDFKDFGPESPRKYVEDEVTIHYRSPVRHEIKEMISEEELARKQAEAMRRIYQEERRRKYLQELQDMNSRRHTDNFIPSQKSPIPLNRYDDFIDNVSMKMKPRDQSPEPRLVARALYNFVGQSSRELTFRKGDVIFIRRQVDKNWYEGEHNAMIGLFPSNYVEIVPYDGIKSTPRKAHEGQARAKFNFIAQTHLELSLAKGELVVLTRRVDDNWYEGRIGSRKGIFPVSYIDVLIDPSEKQESIPSGKPVASPAAHSLLLNGSSGGKESMGSHHYQPSYSPQPTTTSYHAKPVNVIGTSSSYHSLTRTQKLTTPSVNEALHIDTHSEPVPYRALYKYKPQNDDELELLEGDTVYVLEKCDDGWYVGSSQRTGAFGTFPGNYVERI